MLLKVEELKNQYVTNLPLYSMFCKELKTQINELLIEASIKLAVPLEARVKTLDSVLDKYERNNLQLKQLSDINDLAGVRIISLFQSDVTRVCDILKENFNVIRIEDTHNRLSENQFGYGSIHFEILTPESWITVPTLKKLLGLRAEIQIRTISQHSWAASSHILQYKQEKHVPFDFELERLLLERQKYIVSLENEGVINDDDVLNVETLKQIMDNILPPENKGEDEQYDELINNLEYFEITKVGEFRSLLKNNLKAIKEKDALRVEEINEEIENGGDMEDIESLGTTEERNKRGVFFIHTGLVRTALTEEFGDTDIFNKE